MSEVAAAVAEVLMSETAAAVAAEVLTSETAAAEERKSEAAAADEVLMSEVAAAVAEVLMSETAVAVAAEVLTSETAAAEVLTSEETAVAAERMKYRREYIANAHCDRKILMLEDLFSMHDIQLCCPRQCFPKLWRDKCFECRKNQNYCDYILKKDLAADDEREKQDRIAKTRLAEDLRRDFTPPLIKLSGDTQNYRHGDGRLLLPLMMRVFWNARSSRWSPSGVVVKTSNHCIFLRLCHLTMHQLLRIRCLRLGSFHVALCILTM